MDFYTVAKEVLERLKCVDGVVITQHRVVEQALRDAFLEGGKMAVQRLEDAFGFGGASDQLPLPFPPDESPY